MGQAALVEYHITDLGIGIGWDVNESGDVIYGGPAPNISGFLWSDGTQTPLLSLNIGFGAINDHGEIVGNIENAIGHFRASIWRNGVIEQLGTLGGPASSGYGINNAGHVAGLSYLPGGQVADRRAFLWNGSEMINLGVLPGDEYSEAEDLNEQDQVVGTSVGGGTSRGFLYSDGVMKDVGSLGGHTRAWALNDLGHVVGYSSTGTETHAFLYDGVQMHDLGSPGIFSYAHDINNRGQVVGNSAARAVIWDSTHGMRSLEDLIDPQTGWSILSNARAINERGQIVGSGVRGGVEHAFLLTPVPEPSPLLLISLAILLGFGTRHLRHRCSTDLKR